MFRRRKAAPEPTWSHVDGGEPTIIDADIVDDWLGAAMGRELNVWAEIDTLLDQLQRDHPTRVAMVRQSLRWLRSEAGKRHLSWGVKNRAA